MSNIQPFTTVVDWSEIWRLMEVLSAKFYLQILRFYSVGQACLDIELITWQICFTPSLLMLYHVSFIFNLSNDTPQWNWHWCSQQFIAAKSSQHMSPICCKVNNEYPIFFISHIFFSFRFSNDFGIEVNLTDNKSTTFILHLKLRISLLIQKGFCCTKRRVIIFNKTEKDLMIL